MLQKSYPNQESIPENLRGAYIQRGSEWVLDDLSQDHPVIVHKKQLETDLSAERGKVTRLTNEKSSLEGKSIPEGHVAIPASDKTLLDTVKTLNLPAADIKTKVEEHSTLKQKEEERAQADNLRAVARVMGWSEDAVLAIADKLPPLEVRDLMENGKVVLDEQQQPKKTIIAKIKGDGNVVTEKNFSEHFDSTPALKIFEPTLKIQGGDASSQSRQLPQQRSLEGGAGGGGGDMVAQMLKAEEEARKANPNPLMAKASTIATTGTSGTATAKN